jgi:hypothetical protein
MSVLKNIFSSSRLTNPVDLSLLKTDMHSHLIPGLDDGVDSLEKSMILIKEMKKLGYSKLITTPHIQGEFYQNSSGTILSELERVKRELKKQNVDIELQAAAEYLIDEKFKEKIEKGDLLTFGKNHLLVEMSFFNEYPFRSLSRLKQLVQGKKTREDHPQVMNAAVRLYADAANARTKLENGFDLTDYDQRALDFAKDYSEYLLAIDVNLDTVEMLDTTWGLFSKHFRPQEVNMRMELVERYWKK